MDLTPQAKRLWNKIPKDMQLKLLNNVYCTTCQINIGIGNVKGTAEKGDLILRGSCTKCGGPVARLLEDD